MKRGVTMFLLKNDPVFSDLKSDILKIGVLLEEIKQESVTGFIEFDFSEFSAVVLLDEGEILQCQKIENGKAYAVNQSEILKYLEEMKASVGLYKLKKEAVRTTCKVITNEPLFEDMSTQCVDAKKLLLTLEADKFNGMVSVRAEQGECSVVLEKGVPVLCLSEKTSGSGHVECLKEFLGILKEKDALVSVYREKKRCFDIGSRLKEVVREILGDGAENIEKMLENSGKSREELLKTVGELENIVYLFVDEKKADTLLQRLRETIKEEFQREWAHATLKDRVENPLTKVEHETSEEEIPWFLQISCSSYYR